MNLGFWAKLDRPIMALAPMADVTDSAFREMFARYGRPAVMFTEFVSTDGLCSVGRDHLLRELEFSENQRPIVAQIWGRDPQNYFKSAKLIADLGFDGIDINFGCPQRKEVSQGTCAALIEEPELAQEIIEATKKGAGHLPVSVKTRIGFKNINTEKWIGALLECEPAALTIHARTAREMSSVPAHWDEVTKAVVLRNAMDSRTLILGNGDVKSLQEAQDRVGQTGCDGVMIGRGAFGKPWFFGEELSAIEKKLSIMLEHTELYEKMFVGRKNFAVMRKHFKAYATGFAGAHELRAKLMEAEDSKEVLKTLNEFFSTTDTPKEKTLVRTS